ncbi:hypothetical protein [uncultured Dokdonia sp.]|uniref:hypothetical protein n=1 Tax=uncultured Dokdonia sp. TaxID=575653 RepID=UPI002612F0C2|nr:hypothetical protein [uncultured Dokdonia sp.]
MKNSKKLALKKLTISRLNNMETINGGGNLPTKKTLTAGTFFECPTVLDCPTD